ncbi:MAG: ribonuclease III family protein [Candidatus Heimdallarchaeaceae archaeon]
MGGNLCSSFPNPLNLSKILQDKGFAKFGDSVVNFVYNFAVYKSFQILQGVKVSDQCLAEACKSSPLRKYIGTRKNKGELGDAVEAFIGYIVLQDEQQLSSIINKLVSSFRTAKLTTKKLDSETCVEAFSNLIVSLCKEQNIT